MNPALRTSFLRISVSFRPGLVSLFFFVVCDGVFFRFVFFASFSLEGFMTWIKQASVVSGFSLVLVAVCLQICIGCECWKSRRCVNTQNLAPKCKGSRKSANFPCARSSCMSLFSFLLLLLLGFLWCSLESSFWSMPTGLMNSITFGIYILLLVTGTSCWGSWITRFQSSFATWGSLQSTVF